MKRIRIISMRLSNFRGATKFITFTKRNTIIGWNGSGKSRTMDAFRWCLFGKDSQDRKDYEIKSRENGQTLHRVDAEVELVMDVDGTQIILTRTLKEVWVKPRGQEQEVFKGNVTECAIDNVPMKVGDYDKRVAEILTDTLFKMVTDPTYFCNMPWKQQREALFAIVGNIDVDGLVEVNEDYKALMQRLGNKNPNDYKKQIAATKKKAKEQLAEIQPRIDQTTRMMPSSYNWEELQAEIEEADKRIADINESQRNYFKANEAEEKRVSDLQRKIGELEREQYKVVTSARNKAYEDAYKANAEHRELEAQMQELEHLKRITERALQSHKAEHTDTLKAIEDLQKKREELLAQWEEVSGRVNDESMTCPHCGQQLPESMIAEKNAKFEQWKNDTLNAIEAKGQALKVPMFENNTRLTVIEASIKTSTTRLNELTDQLTTARERLQRSAKTEKITVIPEQIPEFVELAKRIESLKQEISSGTSSNMFGTSEWNLQQEEIKCVEVSMRDELVRKLNNRNTITQYKKAIEELEEQGRKLAAEIAGYEREEFILQSYTRDLIAEAETRVNGMFTKVKFQLFDYTIDGNETECCIPLVNGIPYGVANTAGKLHAGFDIIKVLSDYYQVEAPIFVDNSEGLSELPDMPNQMVFMEVSRDPMMRGRIDIVNE